MKLSKYLEDANVRDDVFAALIGRDRSTVNRLRRGEVKPDWNTVARIQEATGGAVTAMDFVPDPPAPDMREAS